MDDDLAALAAALHAQPPSQHIHVARMLHSLGAKLVETNAGLHVNLSELQPDVLCRLRRHADYLASQKQSLQREEERRNAMRF
jgi:hypothetical protein